MKRKLSILVLLLFATLISQAATWHVDPLGTDDLSHGTGTGINAFKTIQYAIDFASVVNGDVINVASGTYVESNILVHKSLTIRGVGATRDAVVIVPTGTDANVDNAFGSGALNGFIIKAQSVTIRKLTINGNPAAIPGIFNFRAGIVTLDASQPGGGVWNNLHVDNVVIKNTWRRGISVFPRTVAGTVIERSSIENVAFNQGMYLAGHSLVLNNTVKHCFQGIVLNPDATTPTGLFKINGNTVTEIGNFPGCFSYPNGQPRAIQFDPVDPTFRAIEIKNNVVNDNGSVGLIGTVGIYTRRANSISTVESNTITLSSGASLASGTQSVGLLLGWSYARAFTAKLNYVTTTASGIGIMLVDVGTADMPMVLEGNVLNSSGSTHGATGDGTGIYIANQYLFNATDKAEAFVKIQNYNRIRGFARGIDVEKIVTSTLPLTVIVHNNLIFGNTLGFDASTLTAPVDATNNWWGDCTGPNHATNPGGLGNAVTNNVSFMPWWCNPGMTTTGPFLTPGMLIRNTSTGAEYTSAQLADAFTAAASGQTLYVAPGLVNAASYNYPGKTVYMVGTGIPGQSIIDGPFTVDAGNLFVLNGMRFINSVNNPTILVNGGILTLRNSIVHGTTGGVQACLEVTGGSVDAGTLVDKGNNQFLAALLGSAINNVPEIGLKAIGNDWGSLTGPTVASNPAGTGGAIIGTGLDSVYYAPFIGGPVTTIASVFACAGVTSVDIPVTATNFNNIGSLALTFGFTPAQLTNPQIVYTNPAFSPWGSFTVTTDLGLLAAGTFKVSGFALLPADGVTLAGGSILFTLRFDILPNAGTNSTAAVFFNENPQGTDCEYATPAPYITLGDMPYNDYYINGGVTLHQLQRISGAFTYYNAANVILTDEDITVKLYKSSDVTHSNLLGTCITNASGYYEFEDYCSGETYDLVATSTHTTDGSVNTTDAAQVNFWPISPTSIEKVRFYAGDVGTVTLPRDWFLSATDAQRIQQNFVNGVAFDRPWTFWKAGQFIAANPVVPAAAFPSVSLISGSDVTANMYGLCTGDFNRSFNPLLKKSASKNLTLIYGRSMQVNINQEFDLPIHVVHACSVGAVSLIINFPSDLVEVKDVRINSVHGELDWAVNGNELRIGWNSINAADLAAFDDLLTLRLLTKETFVKGSSVKLTLAADLLNELANASYDVIGDAILSVDVLEATPNGIGDLTTNGTIALSNYPNPFTARTTISYSLPFNGDVTIEIRNSFGVTVDIPVNEKQTAGNHSLVFDGSSLAAGVYTATIKLNQNSNVASGTIKLVITK